MCRRNSSQTAGSAAPDHCSARSSRRSVGPIGCHLCESRLGFGQPRSRGDTTMFHVHGYGGGHWVLRVLMIVAMVVFGAALGWIIVTLLRQRGTPAGSIPSVPGSSWSRSGSDALRILNERLARGDSDEDEYVCRRSLIGGSA